MKHPHRRTLIAAVVCGTAVFLGIETTAGQKAGLGSMLIVEADLECSFFLADSMPPLRITAPARTGEKTILTEGDFFYVDPAAGAPPFRENEAWSIVEWGPRVRIQNPLRTLGNVVYQRGRARVIGIIDGRAEMKIEKSCGLITVGNFLVPFDPGTTLGGPELDYERPFQGGETLTGRVVFLESDFVQLARGHWALIDLGADQGIEPGLQLSVFRKETNAPTRAIGNVVVIRAGARSATVKILASKDSIRIGDLVQVK